GQQPVVFAGRYSVDPVVGAHHHGGPGGTHHVLERSQVDFSQRTLVYFDGDAHPVGLLVVDREVFDTGSDTGRLHPFDHRGGDPGSEVRVLGEVLEVAAAQWRAFDVHSGPEQHVDSQCPCFAAHGATHATGEVHVPGRSQGDGGWEAGRGHA